MTLDARPQPLVWHYTSIVDALLIIASETLRPTTVNVPEGERPAVWFSAEQAWEPTSAKGLRDIKTGEARTLSMAEQHEHVGVARFGIGLDTPGLVDWQTFKRESGMPPRFAVEFEAVSRRVWGANPDLWFASFEPVPRALWRAVESWDGTRWHDGFDKRKLDELLTKITLSQPGKAADELESNPPTP
jgi:hypothetical protein